MSELTPSDYELSRSRLGPIIRIIRAADGELLDGFHRLEANRDWPEEVLQHIKTPRQKLAVKIATNAMRRRATGEEIQGYVQALAQELLKEGVPSTEVIKEIVLDTGLREHVVRQHLRAEGSTPVMRAQKDKKKPRSRAKPPDEEPPGMPETPRMPERTSSRFQEMVNETIILVAGSPVPEIWNRLITVYGISLEEAQGYVQRFMSAHGDVWSRHYDSRGLPLSTQEEVEDEPEYEEDYSHGEEVASAPPAPQRSGVQYGSNELLAAALQYYPDEVVDRVWDAIQLESRKIPFMKSLFYHCFVTATAHVSIDDLIAKATTDVF